MNRLRLALTLAGSLAGRRAALGWQGHVLRDPEALLHSRRGSADPYRLYDRVRASGRLVRSARGYWISAHHDVCAEVLRDRRLTVDPARLTVPAGLASLFDTSFLGLDPPDHTRLRRLVQPSFAPARVAGLRERVEKIAAGLADALPRGATADLVGSFAKALPQAVLVHLLDIPDEHVARFAFHGEILGSGIDGFHSLAHARKLATSSAEIESIFADLLDRRRRSPGEDVVSVLACAPEGEATPRELLSLCTTLLVAGFETTTNLITNAVHALLRHPGQWDALRADPEGLAGSVVDEVLRYDAPVQRAGRSVPRDVEVAGQRLARGDFVVALIGGANRDPAVHDDPDTFDALRPRTAGNLAFSSGIHYCLGAPLARLEAEVAVRALATRLPRLRAAGRPRRRFSSLVRGFDLYPVEV